MLLNCDKIVCQFGNGYRIFSGFKPLRILKEMMLFFLRRITFCLTMTLGEDNTVRAVLLKTTTGTYTRLITKVCPILYTDVDSLV